MLLELSTLERNGAEEIIFLILSAKNEYMQAFLLHKPGSLFKPRVTNSNARRASWDTLQKDAS